jgi:hypothetical protein
MHSVIIGTSLGAYQDPDTNKAIVFALSLHQRFEGTGLGGAELRLAFILVPLFYCFF